AAIPRHNEFGYFGYLKKMALTLHNIKMMKLGKMPFHGALVRIVLKGNKDITVLIIGDTGAGKSEVLEAFRQLGKDYIQDLIVIADDMGSLDINSNGEIIGYGTEIGAFLRLDDLQPGFAFGQMDRSIIMNAHMTNARIVLPVTTYQNVIHGHIIDFVLYANNYEPIDHDYPIIERFETAEKAMDVFRAGVVMSKGTTTTTGLVRSYFANIFGPPQYKDVHEKIAEKYFKAFFKKGIFVGQIRTRLGMTGFETSGPKEAAEGLLKTILGVPRQSAFLVQVFLLLSLAKVAGELLRKRNLPAFTGEILVGVFLGPTIFGRVFPWLYQFVFPSEATQQNMLATVAWMGILFLLLETGLEMDFSSAIRQSRDALKIALSDIIIPITLSFVACLFLPDRYLVDPNQRILFAFFMATIMSISAMAITARAFHDLNISKTDFSFLVLSALSINDMIGWLIFTVVFGLFAQSQINLFGFIFIASLTVGFTFLCLTIGRQLVDRAISEIKVKKEEQPVTALTFICLLGLFCGALAQKIGIYALFGFFVAGIMAGSAKALTERTRHVISQMVHAIFVPLFFASIGLRIDVLKNFNIVLVLFVTCMSIGGKFLGAWVGAGLTKTPKSNRIPIAIAHTSGGIMEIVIGLRAYFRGYDIFGFTWSMA
ncbi:MAG: cation:proton antiporter, partial [Candidatus Omnitrophica bacterium]|nr:cation:proton antiporter [Candidatus Omnitrophota bacterium]